MSFQRTRTEGLDSMKDSDCRYTRIETSVLILGVILVNAVIAATVYACAKAEFSRSVWVTQGHTPPAITAVFGMAYTYVWVTLTALAAWGLALTARPSCSRLTLGCYLAAASLHGCCWFSFFFLALYVVNQTFLI